MLLVLPQCPTGCDPSFLQYVTWKGSTLRIIKDTYDREHGHRWSGVLRCADCGEQVIFTDLPAAGKIKLDQTVEAAVDQCKGLVEQYDQEALERQLAFTRYLEETGRA